VRSAIRRATRATALRRRASRPGDDRSAAADRIEGLGVRRLARGPPVAGRSRRPLVLARRRSLGLAASRAGCAGQSRARGSATGSPAAPGAMAVAGCAATAISARGSPTGNRFALGPHARDHAVGGRGGSRCRPVGRDVHTEGPNRPDRLVSRITCPRSPNTPLGHRDLISVSLTVSSQALTSDPHLMSRASPRPAARAVVVSGAGLITRVMSRSGSRCPADDHRSRARQVVGRSRGFPTRRAL